MALIMEKLVGSYRFVINDLADFRTKDMFLVGSPFPVLLLLVLYHKFIYKWGPEFMKNRQPYNLKHVLIVYNIIQIVFSVILVYDAFFNVYLSGYYNLKCAPIHYVDSPIERIIVQRVWQYYIIKIIDLLDTVFFTLKKNTRQVTFLHVYHHIGMVLLGYVGTKYVPGGHGVLLGLINSFVHAVMYTYYLVTAWKPELRHNIWWKKYITQLQIAQFLLLSVHFTHVLFQSNCSYPKWVSFLFIPQNVFMLYMFVDFYIKEYIKKDKKKNA